MPTNPTSTGSFTWEGSTALPEETEVTCPADVSGSLGGKYWYLFHPLQQYYVWYNVGQAESSSAAFNASEPIANYYGTYFTISSPSTDYYVWYAHGANYETDPALPGKTGIKVDFNALKDGTAQPDAICYGEPVAGKPLMLASARDNLLRATAKNTRFWDKLQGTGGTSMSGYVAVEFLNNFYWAIGYYPTSAFPREIHRSVDGVSGWTIHGSFSDTTFVPECIDYMPSLGRYVVGGADSSPSVVGINYYSSDGSSWTLGSTPTVNGNWYSITNDNTTFVAADLGGRLLSSTDGINWTVRQTTSGEGPISVVWSPEESIFVSVTNLGSVHTSPDGITWTARTTPAEITQATDISQGYYPFLGGKTIFVICARNATSNGLIVTSNDGITWSTSYTFAGASEYALASVYHKINSQFAFVGRTAGLGAGGAWRSSDPNATLLFPVTEDTTITQTWAQNFSSEVIRRFEGTGSSYIDGPFWTTSAFPTYLNVKNFEDGPATDINAGTAPISAASVLVQGAGSSTDPGPFPSVTGVEVSLAIDDTASDVATKTANELNALSNFNASYLAPDKATIQNSIVGEIADAFDVDAGVTIVVTQQGTSASSGPPPITSILATT